MNMTLIPTAEINVGIAAHLSVAEAARSLGVAESTIRSAARRLGVNRFSGRAVSGGIRIDAHPVPIIITYSGGRVGGAR